MSTEEPKQKWEKQDVLNAIGDIEAILSLILWGFLLVAQERPSHPKEGLVKFIFCLAFAFALALGGLRFGTALGKTLGWLLVVVTGLVIVGIIYVNHTKVPWGVIRRFWGELLF